MMSYFFFVPYAELTQEMINLSVSRRKEDIPVQTINSQPFYLLEVESSLSHDRVFNAYRQYLASELADASPEVPAQKISYEGIFKETVTCNGTRTFDYTVSADKIISEVIFEANNTAFGDYIAIKVLLSGNVIGTYIQNFYVSDETVRVSVPKTLIVSGLVIRVEYTSVSVLTNPKFFMNMIWSNT